MRRFRNGDGITPIVGEPDMPFPELEEVWKDEDSDIEAMQMLRFLLGERWERPVPWEPRR
jgi:hypothetical protein